MDTQLGYWRWKLFRWNDHPNPYRNNSDLAFTWLSQFQSNFSAMSELRNLLGSTVTGGYSPTDPQLILKQIADKMASGEIQACVEVCGPVPLSASIALAAEAPEPDLTQLQSAPPPPPPPAPAPDSVVEPTLSPDCDPVSQAQVLKNAAESGAPFCEECEKRANAAQNGSAPPPPPAPQDPPEPLGPASPVEFSGGMKQSSQSGDAFGPSVDGGDE